MRTPHSSRRRVALPAVVMTAALLVVFAAPAHAASIGVTTTADELNSDGDCSLREAIVAANTDTAVDACTAGSGADVITVPVGTYVLALPGAGEDANLTGDLDVASDLTITGAGAGMTILDGADLDRVLHIVSGTAAVSGLTVQNGRAQAGGGIFNEGAGLTLTDLMVSGNEAAGGSPTLGGGILNTSPLTLTDSTVSGNTAGNWGGGLYNDDTASVVDNVVDGNTTTEDSAENRGGGIFNSGMLTLTNTAVSNNVGKLFGGGIYNTGNASLTNSTVSGNQNTGAFFGGADNICCGGGILNLGTLTVTDSTLSGNAVNGSGGALENAGTATIVGTTISQNTAPNSSGAGILNSGLLTVENSTLSGNASGGVAGGLFNNGTATITFTTFSENFAGGGGGGVYVSTGTVRLGSSILANSSSAGGDCSGSITSDGFNLIEANSCAITGNTTGNVIGVDPMLGPLGSNGGPTMTHALLAGSPALAAADPACPPPATDQRGRARPQGFGCDIGAYELDATPVGIDVQPGSSTNVLNVSRRGAVRVAVLGSQTLDASRVDTTRVCFGDAEAPAERDCTLAGAPMLQDVNRDRIRDLVLQFEVEQTGIDAGDTQACLNASLVDGTPIGGCDAVRT